MNYSTAIFLVNRDVRAVLVTYEPDIPNQAQQPRTMFKTMDPTIKVDDYVVVPTNTRHLATVVKVTDVDVEVDYDSTKDVQLIICQVDRSNYNHVLAMEASAIQAIKSAETRKKREELAKNLLADMDSDASERLRACPRCGMTAQTLRVIEYVKTQEASPDLYQDRPSFFPVAAEIVGRGI